MLLQQCCMNLEITVYPTTTPPPAPKPPKQDRSALRKYKFSRRTKMLAIPKRITPKFEPPPLIPASSSKHEEPEELDAEVEWRSKQMAYPPIRRLVVNKKEFEKAKLSPKLIKNVDKHLKNTWNSIYNYYRKHLKAKRLKKLQKRAAKRKAKKEKGKKAKKPEEIEKEQKERYDRLAKPKPIPKPKKIPKKWKPLEQLLPNCNILATPKEYDIEPPKDITKVASATQTYQPTEACLRLAKLPPRMMMKEEKWPPWPTGVNPRAKYAKVTERIAILAKPNQIVSKGKKDDDDQEGWFVNPKALKYKATPRILELAKPSERD